jgi:hypothetical protein
MGEAEKGRSLPTPPLRSAQQGGGSLLPRRTEFGGTQGGPEKDVTGRWTRGQLAATTSLRYDRREQLARERIPLSGVPAFTPAEFPHR